MCLPLPLHRPSTSIPISISIYNYLSLSLYPSLYLSPLSLPLPLPLSLPLPLPLYLSPTCFSYSGHDRHSNQQRGQCETATATKCSRNCGESRRHCDQFHCDHMNRYCDSLAQPWSVSGTPTSRGPRVGHGPNSTASRDCGQWSDEGPTPAEFQHTRLGMLLECRCCKSSRH